MGIVYSSFSHHYEEIRQLKFLGSYNDLLTNDPEKDSHKNHVCLRCTSISHRIIFPHQDIKYDQRGGSEEEKKEHNGRGKNLKHLIC